MESPSSPTQTSPRPTVKRICIDARFYHTGTGVARYIKALVTHLQQIDHTNDYTVIVRNESVKEASQNLPANWHVAGLDIEHYSFGEQIQFLQYLNKEKFDLVYFTMFNHPILYRGKSVIMIHDVIMHLYPPRPIWHPRTWVYRFVMWHAAHFATAIINNSQTTKRDVVKYLGVPESKCHVTLLAVEDTFQPADAKTIASVKAKFGIDKPYLFFLNAWRPHKGLPELVSAFTKVKESHDIQLVLAGKPDPRFPEVIAAVEHNRSSDVITPGFISDEEMMALLTGSELYINPSHYEGFGFGLLEAMACHAPVVSADNQCLKEVGSDAAAYFKTKNPNDLAKVITELLDNQATRETLIKKGQARIKDFSFKTMAQQTLDVFNKILSS